MARFKEGWEEVAELLRTSDVFHFHMTADEYIELGRSGRWTT
jgi:hypothetical protein